MPRGPLPTRLGIGLAAGLAGVLILLAVRRSSPPLTTEFKELPSDILPSSSTGIASNQPIITPDTSPDPTQLILPDGSDRSKDGPAAPVGIAVRKGEEEELFAKPLPQTVEHISTVERRERFRGYIEQLKALREALMGDFTRPVVLSGNTAKLLAGPPKASGPIADGDAPTRWSGSYGGQHDAGTRTVADPKAWREFWTLLTQDPIPQVDFTRHRVAAVFLGQRPTSGYAVEIIDVVPTAKAVVVRYRETTPSTEAAPMATPTSPYALLAIPAGTLPVAFKKDK